MNFKIRMHLLTISYVLVFILCIVLYKESVFKVEVFGTSLILITTIFFALRNYFLEYDKFFKVLFVEFNKRYDEINYELNSITDNTVLSETQTNIVIDYFNICAEEYMWERRGRIPARIFSSWLNGSLYHLRKAPIKKLFESELSTNRKSYYGWGEFTNKHI